MYQLIILFFGVVAAVTATQPSRMLYATVRLEPHNVATRNVNGELRFVQNEENGPVNITGWVRGLTEGLHGMHVHEKGDLSEGCMSTGAHFNPYKVSHGGPNSPVRHVGDLGNIWANADGESIVNIVDSIISLSGPNSILNRGMVVHSGEDDLGKGSSPLSLTTGNSGDRWACGVIKIVSNQ